MTKLFLRRAGQCGHQMAVVSLAANDTLEGRQRCKWDWKTTLSPPVEHSTVQVDAILVPSYIMWDIRSSMTRLLAGLAL
jgi:hypothetical protein